MANAGAFGLRSSRVLLLATVASIGLFTALLAYWMLRDREQEYVEASLRYNSQVRMGAIDRQISVSLGALDATRAFFKGSEHVDREEFRSFADAFPDIPGLTALGWAPAVPESQRAMHEKTAREQGIGDYAIREKSPDGADVSATDREVHQPVYYLKPIDYPCMDLGFDLASLSQCAQAIETARDTGQKTATGCLRFDGKHGPCELLVFLPIYRNEAILKTVEDRRRDFEGVVFGVLEVGKVVDIALQFMQPIGIDIYVFDETGPEAALLFGRPSVKRDEPFVERSEPPAIASGLLVHPVSMPMAGRVWGLYFTPTRGFIEYRTSWLPSAALVVIGVITFLLVLYLGVVTGRAAYIEQLVVERTAELQQANDALADEVAERRRAQQALQEEQSRLLQMLELQERDRKLVAYEIHDGFVQKAVGAQMLLQAFEYRNDVPDLAREAAERIRRLTEEGIAEARRTISGLRPPLLEQVGVLAAIEELIDDLRSRGDSEIEFYSDVHFERLSPPLEAAIFRIVQESLGNAQQHSQSDRVRVSLVQMDQTLRIEVEDWGVGFDPTKAKPGHFGLEGIRQRARLFGGRATFDSSPGDGALVAVELPILPGRDVPAGSAQPSHSA